MTLPSQQQTPLPASNDLASLAGVCLTCRARCVPVLVSPATSENPAAKVSMLWGHQWLEV